MNHSTVRVVSFRHDSITAYVRVLGDGEETTAYIVNIDSGLAVIEPVLITDLKAV